MARLSNSSLEPKGLKGRVQNRQVVQELKDGNRLGCSYLVELYQDRLLNEAIHVFHVDALDAEEVVSDVLLAVVDKIQVFEFKRTDGDFHLWVMTIFRNRVSDFFKHKALRDGLLETFEESRIESEVEYSNTEREVVASIVRQYEETLREPDGPENASPALQAIADTLEEMETWERVLLRCRALDVSYEEIAGYTGKPVKQLKVYHARVKKKFTKLLAQKYPKLMEHNVEALKVI
jgi:RNA polymerase sigma factor (sigma-70 family)